VHTGFWWGSRPLEKPGIEGRLILKLVFRTGDVAMDWIDLAKVKNMWRFLVNAVINCWVL
jgi:hypothetical protein